ncbi:MAG: hypothetical protein FD167_1275 [bacterium]|nr:MAG: hypothetical protein FD167_1275 [bacterium]
MKKFLHTGFIAFLVIVLTLSTNSFGQLSTQPKVVFTDFSARTTAPATPGTGIARFYWDGTSFKVKRPNGAVATMLDSANVTATFNGHNAVITNSNTYTLSTTGRGIITLTGDQSGRKITSISNGIDGQIIELHFSDSNVTVDSGAAKLLGNVDFVGANFSSLRLAYNGTEWREAGRSQAVGLLGVPVSATTLAASATATLSSTLSVTGNFAINTNKFNVTAASGNTTVAGTLGVTGLSTFGSFKGTTNLGSAVVALTPATIVALDSTLGNTFTLTPAQDTTINIATVPATDQLITLKVLTSGTTSYSITFGTNIKSTATLATGTTTAKVFVVTFRSDGTNFNEVSRTTAM